MIESVIMTNKENALAKLNRNILGLTIYVVLSFGTVLVIFPFYWMVTTSLKTLPEAQSIPPTFIPATFQLKNFVEAWHSAPFGRYFFNSIFTCTTIVVVGLITSSLAAFAFAKMRFAGRKFLFFLILSTMMIPGQVLIIPSYLIVAHLGWLNSYKSLIIPWLANVFTIFLMRQFFMTIPDDLMDASKIDGASKFRSLWMIVIPLSKPVIITAGIFDFLMNWNALLWPLIVAKNPKYWTLMVGLSSFNNDAGSEFHLLMAASTFAVLPIIIAFFFLQRFFIQGIARTGLKG